MKIHNILLFFFLCAPIESVLAMEEINDDTFDFSRINQELIILQDDNEFDFLFMDQQLAIQEQSLSGVLKNQNWLSKEDQLMVRPISPANDEIIAYYGNVPPTSLYKQDKTYYLPTAPVVYVYNPVFNWGYVDVAYSLIPTEAIKKFFGQPEMLNCFLVFQRLIDDNVPQLLRLHGFIHGSNAGTIGNSSVQVAVELMSFEEQPITFTNKNPVQTNSVHCHGGVASPSNFDLIGVKEDIYTMAPVWQSLGIYLPATKTATLIVMGQNIIDHKLSFQGGEPILDDSFRNYFEKLLSK
jgi:hypothetical protein